MVSMVTGVKADRSYLSHAMYNGEIHGPHADVRNRGQKVNQSIATGRPVQRLANQMVTTDNKGRELLDDQSDASTVEGDVPQIMVRVFARFER